jgi:hypothetical protein
MAQRPTGRHASLEHVKIFPMWKPIARAAFLRVFAIGLCSPTSQASYLPRASDGPVPVDLIEPESLRGHSNPRWYAALLWNYPVVVFVPEA